MRLLYEDFQHAQIFKIKPWFYKPCWGCRDRIKREYMWQVKIWLPTHQEFRVLRSCLQCTPRPEDVIEKINKSGWEI